jgi:hypothetical protein
MAATPKNTTARDGSSALVFSICTSSGIYGLALDHGVLFFLLFVGHQYTLLYRAAEPG